MSSNSPFAPKRAKGDLLNALPAVGMVTGAVLGVGVGALQGVGGPVSLGGAGIAVGLALGLLGRAVWRPRD
jgi:hypothetical protein